jgi:hypothetical protein
MPWISECSHLEKENDAEIICIHIEVKWCDPLSIGLIRNASCLMIQSWKLSWPYPAQSALFGTRDDFSGIELILISYVFFLELNWFLYPIQFMWNSYVPNKLSSVHVCIGLGLLTRTVSVGPLCFLLWLLVGDGTKKMWLEVAASVLCICYTMPHDFVTID